MADEIKYYDLPCLPRVVSDNEIEALTGMFAHPGWSVFMQMRKIQSNDSTDKGMSLVVSEADRTQHRARYHGCQHNLTFEKELGEDYADAVPLTDEQLENSTAKEEDFDLDL